MDSVVTDDPAQVGTEMLVIDYNTEGGTDKDTLTVTRYGTESPAFVHLERITPTTTDLAGARRAVLDREAAEEAAERKWLEQQQLCSTRAAE